MQVHAHLCEARGGSATWLKFWTSRVRGRGGQQGTCRRSSAPRGACTQRAQGPMFGSEAQRASLAPERTHSTTAPLVFCAPTGAWQQPVRPRDAARGKGARGVRSCGVTGAQCVLLACTAPRWARTHSGSGWHFPICRALRCVPRSADRQPLSSLTCTTLAAAGAALHARRRGSAQRGPSAWAACAAAEAACEREARQQRPLCGQVPRRGLGGSSFASCPSAVAW